MQFMRKAALVLVVPIFTLLLFTLAIDIGVTRIVTHPAKIKQIISGSGVYNSVVTGLLDQAKSVSGQYGSISLSNPLVRTAASQAITPGYLQQNTETFIDSIYAWLDGKTTTPDFRIDLTGVKTKFAMNVLGGLQQQLSTLPVCATNPVSFDPFNANCMPKGLTVEAAVNQVGANLLTGKGFLDNPVITANDVKSKDTNANIFNDKLKDAPKTYQKAKKAPLVLSLLTLLVAAIIVILSVTRRKGFRRVGITLLVVGLFMLVFAYGLNQAVKNALPKLDLNNVVVQEKVKVLARDISQDIDKTYWIIGGAYAVLGALLIGGTMFLMKDKEPKSKDSATPKTPTDDSPGGPAPRPAPRPAKKRVLVQ